MRDETKLIKILRRIYVKIDLRTLAIENSSAIIRLYCALCDDKFVFIKCYITYITRILHCKLYYVYYVHYIQMRRIVDRFPMIIKKAKPLRRSQLLNIVNILGCILNI